MRIRPILFLILVVVAGYLGYRWFSSRPPEVWNYIPESASVVISSDKLQDQYDAPDTLEKDAFHSAYRDLPLISLAAGNLSLMRWFNQDETQIYTFLKSKTITYAFHPLAGGRLGIVMYLPVKSELEEKWLNNPKASSLRVSSHNFQGHIITDISNERSEALFSYILKNNYLIISQYGELIEDVVRNARSGGGRAGENSMKEITLPEGRHDLSIYTNGEAWRGFVFPQGIHPNVSAFLDILPGRHGIHLAPPSAPGRLVMESEDINARENPYYSLLNDQSGASFTNTGYISQQTTHLIRLAVEKPDKFNPAFRKWIKDRQSLPALARFGQLAGKSKDAFFREIGPEVILCVNESSGGISDSKVMLVRYENFEEVKPAIRQIADKTSNESTKTTSFQGYEVYPILIPDLMEAVFGPLFKGFRESYFTYIAPYLIVGNSPQAVQNYLIDYENQLTWAHSPDLDSTLFGENTAQLSLITNMSKARAGSGLNRTTLKSSLDQIATTQMAYSQKGRNADLSLVLNYAVGSRARNKTELKADFEWKDEFPPVLSVMPDPGNGTSEIILTNKSHQLIGIDNSESGKPRILAQLDGPMVGRAFRADFLNIGRPQRIVSTARFLYVLDEDENGIFTLLSKPAVSPTTSLYRISHSLESGASFVLKGADQNLYTWKTAGATPSKLNLRTDFDNLLSPVVSFAKGNSNLYIVTQRNGKIFVLDEKGKSLPGFPVDMLSGISGPFAPVQNPSTGEIEIAGVNRQGEFTQIDLNGGLTTRKQLLLPQAGCTFRTLYDENTLDWLMLRQTSGKAAILSKDGKEIFEIVGLRPDFTIRYHYFGSDNRFISVVSGGFISIFDFNGNRIGDTPIPCRGALGINYEGARKELSIFSQAEDKIRIWSVKL